MAAKKQTVRRRVVRSTPVSKGRWRVGIDPGFGLTGLVLVAPDDVVAAFATYHSPVHADVIGRTAAIGNSIVTHILQWVWQFNIRAVDIGIEMPVYRNNAGTLMLQMRLVQEIESGLYHLIGPELKSCYVYEVDPTTSKKLATGKGNADKGEMIVACPLLSLWGDKPMSKEIMEAVADAWAHTLITLQENAAKYDIVDIAYAPCDQACDCVLIDPPAQSEYTELSEQLAPFVRLVTREPLEEEDAET